VQQLLIYSFLILSDDEGDAYTINLWWKLTGLRWLMWLWTAESGVL